MNFFCYKLRMHEIMQVTLSDEAAYLLMTGKVIFHYLDQMHTVERAGFLNNYRSCYCPTNTPVTITALTDCGNSRD